MKRQTDSFRVLVCHCAALGDTVLLWTLLRRLNDVVLVSSKEKGKLTQRFLPHVVVCDANSAMWTKLFSSGLTSDECDVIHRDYSEFDHVISFVAEEGDVWDQNAKCVWPGAKIHFLSTRPGSDSDGDVHITTRWEKQLTDEGLSLRGVRLTPNMNSTGNILLHPGSGGLEKCWALDRFETLYVMLEQNELPVSLIVGEAELERWGDWIDCWREKYDVIVTETYDELCDAITRCVLYVGNDAGPTHLAAQLGIRTLVLFGPTQPGVWAPRGPDVQILAPDSPEKMDWLEPERVFGSINDIISKIP